MPEPGRRRRRGPINANGEKAESAWQSELDGLLRFYGWLGYHTHRSDRSPAGFPDTTATRHLVGYGPELLFAELKTDSGRTSQAQDIWLRLLGATETWQRAWVQAADDLGVMPEHHAVSIGVYLWRPSQRLEVEQILAGPRGPGLMVTDDELETPRA